MTMTISTAVRSARLTAMVTALGSNASAKLYNGTKPTALGVPAGTLLATLTYGTDITSANGGTAGGVAAGVLTLGGVTQVNANHVAGTPTFVRFSTSGGTVVADIDIGSGAGTVQFTGAVANAQNVTASGLTITDGNA
jgi:hypothetical protein